MAPDQTDSNAACVSSSQLLLQVWRRPFESSQYTAIEFGQRCRDAGVRPSMGSVGDAYDNAMCESFFATLECELLARCRFKTPLEARSVVFRLHRRLQPTASPLLDRLPLADRLRAAGIKRRCRRTPACRRARGRQGQALQAAAKRGHP
jgi:hypothetical protein